MSPPHVHDLGPFVHSHAFGDDTAPRRERALWQVTWITLATMALELAVGWWSGSLALTANSYYHSDFYGARSNVSHFPFDGYLGYHCDGVNLEQQFDAS